MSEKDPVNPAHYKSLGVEPIEAIEAWKLGFNLGNAVKYIARAGKKDPTKTVEDLKKSCWYLRREIANLSPIDLDGLIEDAETNMEIIERLSELTGYEAGDVVSMALGLYEDAMNAKKDGLHPGVTVDPDKLSFEWFGLFEGDDGDDEAKPDEESVFKKGDIVSLKNNPEARGEVQYVTKVDEGDGYHVVVARVIWDDPIAGGCQWTHYRTHELKPWTPTNEGPTISAERCASCGTPMIHAWTEVWTGINEGTTKIHPGCLTRWAYRNKPKFAVGDKVQDAFGSSPTYGFVKSIRTSDNGRLVYVVEWTEQVDSETNRFTDEHWESELKPFEADEPVFAFGDKVRRDGDVGFVTKIISPTHIAVAWEDGSSEYVDKKDAVHASK